MKITLNTKETAAVLAKGVKALPAKPILLNDNNVLISADKSGISFSTTDGEMSIRTTVATDKEKKVSVKEAGELSVDARKLLEMLSIISDETVTLESANDTCIVLRYGNGHQEMPSFNAAEFRPLVFEAEDPSTVTIPAPLLTDALSNTLFNCGNDPLRPALGCVLLETSENGGHIVTTDSRSLMIQSIPDLKTGEPVSFMLPQKQGNLLLAAIKTLKDENDSITIDFGKNIAVFKAGTSVISIKAVQGKFPDWKRVIPDTAAATSELTVAKEALISALKRVSVCANKANMCVKMAFSRDLMESNMELSATDLNFSLSARENIPVEFEGEKLDIGFNAELLGDIVKHMDSEKVKVYFTDARKPAVIIPTEQKDSKSVKAVIVPIMTR